VLFASFVVKILFRIWLRLCRAGSFVVQCVSLLLAETSPQRSSGLDVELETASLLVNHHAVIGSRRLQ